MAEKASTDKEHESTPHRGFLSDVGGFQIKDVLMVSLRYWYWFVISVALCLGVAAIKLKQTNPVYSRTATLIIKSDTKKSNSSIGDNFNDMGIFGSRSTLLDEKAMLESPDLMEEVVKRLNLQVSYTGVGVLEKPVLYGSQLPLTVDFPEFGPEETAHLSLDITSSGMVDVKSLTVNGRSIPLPKQPVAFGTSIKTPSGPVIINKTPFYRKGETLDLNVSRGSLSNVRLVYSGKLNVENSKEKSNVLTLTLHDTSVQRASEVLATLIEVYNQAWLADRNQAAVSTSNFINERLNVIEKELSNVDQDISDFKSTNQVPDVGTAGSMAMTQRSADTNELLSLNNQLQVTKYLKDYIQRESNKYQILPQNSGINNSSIEAQIATYNNGIMQRNSYLQNSSEDHPLVIDLDSRLASIRKGILSSVDNQIMALTTTIHNLERQEQRTVAQISANPSQARYLLSVERQQKVKESLYLYLLQKREENELSQKYTASNTRVVMRPMGSNAPTSPDAGRMYLMAFVIGMAIPFGVISVKEYTNTKVRGRHDLENLSIPIIGEIPLSRKAQKQSKQSFLDRLLRRKNTADTGTDDANIDGGIVVKEGRRNAINEAFRVTRTNLGFMTDNEGSSCDTVMITSFNPGSGKTFITMNLGVTLAIKGKRVLLIDGDLRRATLSKYVGSPAKGLSNYLVNSDISLSSVIVPSKTVSDLYMLPVGSIPPNPTELLESKRFKNLMEELKKEYDYILIDCPPMEMMADAQIINNFIDRTLVVCRVGLLERAMLDKLQRLYDEKKYKNIGIIINGAHADGSRYGYGYGYYSYGYYGYGKGYGYGYSYGDTDEED